MLPVFAALLPLSLLAVACGHTLSYYQGASACTGAPTFVEQIDGCLNGLFVACVFSTVSFSAYDNQQCAPPSEFQGSSFSGQCALVPVLSSSYIVQCDGGPSPSPAAAPWSQGGHDSAHTSRSQFIGAQAGVVKWVFGAGGAIGASVSVGSDGSVYVSCEDGNVYAIIGASGDLRWQYDTQARMLTAPALSPDGALVYVGNDDAMVYALSTASGAVVWNITADNGYVESSPSVSAIGTVYVGSAFALYALNGSTGSVLWSHATSQPILSSPTVGTDGTIYCGADDNNMYAYDGSTGAVLWDYATGGYALTAALGNGNAVYFASEDGSVYALNGVSGTLRWKFTTGGWPSFAPALGADGTVVFGSGDGRVYAVNGTTGSEVWNYTTGSSVASSAAIGADGTVYIGSDDENVYALNGLTGALLWNCTTGSPVRSPAAIGGDGTVYIGTQGASLYAFAGPS